MSEPAYYVTSDYYAPGTITEAGMGAAAVVAIVAIFVGAIVGSRILLRRSRNLSRRNRKILKFISGLARPAGALNLGRRRERKLGSRKKTEDHYRMQAASAVTVSASVGDDEAPPQAAPRKRGIRDLSLLPQEAWPHYAEDEIDAVVEVLRSGKVNQWTGTKVLQFEQAYAREIRNGRAIALANGSLALELALRAFGIGPGDEVIVTPRTFVASAFCVQLVGATPVFAEVDRDSGNITAATIADVISPRTKAVIPVHIGGWPADMPAIVALAREHDFLVIEDCAQAHGAEIDGLPVGSFGDAAAFSFCQDKIISTGGEGGLLIVRDDQAFERAWSFKDHGKNRERAFEKNPRPGFRWLHDSVGTNWRLTEMAAAIGLLQLEKLPNWRARRIQNAQSWADALSPLAGIRVPQPPRNVTGAYYKFYAYVDVDPAGNEELRDRILEAVTAAGIRAFSGSCSEIYREAAFDGMDIAPLPIARELGRSSLMFEVHPTLDTMRLRDRAEAVAAIIRDILG